MLRRKSVSKTSGNAGSMANVFCLQDMQSQHNSLNGEFLLYQVILKRLLANGLIDSSEKIKLIEHFVPTDEKDKTIMIEYDTSYKGTKAVYWYTRESCIYRLLNKALRTQNIGDLVAFTQFIRDLYNQLAYEQIMFLVTSPSRFLTVYRGQMISVDEVNRIKYAKGQLLSMNSFLSTSTNRQQALEFAMSGAKSDTLTTILLEISLNLEQSTRPYADVKNLSAFAKEDEVLFMFGCVFRIDEIWFDKKLQIWRANLTLCSDEDGDLTRFQEELEKELEGKNVLVCLGTYLIQMQKFDEAEIHYETLLKDKLIKDDLDIASCYHGLAQVNEKKGEYDDARKHLDVAMNYLSKDSKSKDHPLIVQCHNDLGLIHSYQENYPLAFHHYEQALKIDKNNHSITYSGLSKLHFRMKNYKIALEYQYKCLTTQSNTTPLTMANTFIEFGKIFTALKQFDKAINMFERAIQNQQQALSSDHPDLGYTYIAMGQMYSDFDQETKAFECIQKAYDLQLKSLPNNHSDFAESFKNFGSLYKKKGDYDRALEYFHKLLENQLKTLSGKHPSVAETYSLLGNTYLARNNYDLALDYLDKLLKNQLQRLSTGNPAITETYNTIGQTYLKKDALDEALDNFRKSLKNDLERKLPDDSSLIDIYKILANLYLKTEDYSLALIHLNRLVDAQSRVKPLDEKLIDDIYEIIGNIYAQNNFFDNTLLYFGNLIMTQMQNRITNTIDLTDSFRMIESVHFEKRHLDQVLRYFEELLKVELEKIQVGDPKLSHLYKVLGNIQLEKRNMDDALVSYENLMKNELTTKSSTDPMLIDIYKVIGNINMEIHNYDQALIYLKKLLLNQLKTKPSDYRTLIKLYKLIANIYFEKSDFPQALIYYNHLFDCQLQTNSKVSNETLIDIGKVFLHHNRFDSKQKAKIKFITTARLPRSFRIISLTKNSNEHRYFNRILSYFEQSIKEKSSLSNSYKILADIYLEMQSFDQAVKYFHKLLHYELKIIPINDSLIIEIYKLIGVIHFEREDLKHSIKYFRKLLTKLLEKTLVEDPSLADIYQIIGIIYFKQHQFSRALLYFNLLLDCHVQAKSIDTESIKETYSYIQMIYLTYDYFEQSIFKPLSSASSSALKIIEGKYFDQRHRDQAISYFQQILDKQSKTLPSDDSSFIEIYKIIANINLTKQDYNQALLYFYKLLTKIVDKKTTKDSSLVNVYRTMAYIYFHRKIYDEALLFFSRCIFCESQNLVIEEIYTMIGKIYSIRHVYNPTEEIPSDHWKQLIDTQTKSEQKLLLNLYQILHNNSFISYYRDQALNYFLKLLRLQVKNETSNSEFTTDIYYLIIANIHLDKRDYNQALYYFNKSIETTSLKDSSLADIYAIMAKIHIQNGQFNQGVAEYKTALSIYNKNYSSSSHIIKHIKQHINESILRLEN